MIKKPTGCLLLSLGLLTSLQAEALEIIGSKAVNILTINTLPGAASTQEKRVYLLKVKLAQHEIDALALTPLIPSTYTLKAESMPTANKLAMENFAVLNQGVHGSCVTFATGAALNYVMNKFDPEEQVSELCSLALGTTLEKQSREAGDRIHLSGWDGSYGFMVLDQFMEHGYLTMAKQKNYGCGGLTSYPVADPDTGLPMSIEDYHNLSQSLQWSPISAEQGYQVSWSHIVKMEDRFADSYNYDGETALTKIKKVILENSEDSKNIPSIGLLMYGDFCHAGACGKHHVKDDTWVVTKKIDRERLNRNPPEDKHQLVIIGYDDDATAIDINGKVHKGLLTVRNSWGKRSGDQGNYYISYDYFKLFADESQKISSRIVNKN